MDFNLLLSNYNQTPLSGSITGPGHIFFFLSVICYIWCRDLDLHNIKVLQSRVIFILSFLTICIMQPPVINNLPGFTDVREDQQTQALIYTLNVTDESPADTVTCSMVSSPVTSDFVVQIIGGSSGMVRRLFIRVNYCCLLQLAILSRSSIVV